MMRGRCPLKREEVEHLCQSAAIVAPSSKAGVVTVVSLSELRRQALISYEEQWRVAIRAARGDMAIAHELMAEVDMAALRGAPWLST